MHLCAYEKHGSIPLQSAVEWALADNPLELVISALKFLLQPAELARYPPFERLGRVDNRFSSLLTIRACIA